MYKEYCLGIIAPAMCADMEVFRRGVMFAICSIRQATINVPDQLAILFDGEQDESPLFGHKFDAWAYISDNAKCAALWRDILDIPSLDGKANKSAAGAQRAIIALLRVPGLGIVKAAFVAQLMGFDVACLDSRNVKREGRNPRAYQTRGEKSGRKFSPAMVERYVAETHGRAEEYWNAWCRDVAEAYKRTPEEISALHLAIIPPNYVPF